MRAYVNLTQHQIDEIAAWAVNSYEYSGSWKAAYRAAAEFARDEYGKVRPNAVKLALRLAQVKWEGYRLQARQACAS